MATSEAFTAAANPNKENCMFADASDNAMVSDQQALVGNSTTQPITTTYSAGTPPTAATTQTIANAATPTVVELLQYCHNLEGVIHTLRSALISHGLMADA